MGKDYQPDPTRDIYVVIGIDAQSWLREKVRNPPTRKVDPQTPGIWYVYSDNLYYYDPA